MLMFFFIYCFLGWIWESTYVSIAEHKLTNRGFLRGPAIPIYGFGAIMIILATTPFRGQYIKEFFMGMLAATVFELIVGILMERIFKIRYWDYSHKRFQFKGYICLESSLCWGVMSVLAAEILQVHMEKYVFAIPDRILMTAVSLFSAIFIVDTVTSVRDAWGVRNIVVALEKIKKELDQLQDNLEAHSEEFVGLLEERIAAKKKEIEDYKEDRAEQLAYEIKLLKLAIEQEKEEREEAKAAFSARLQHDIHALHSHVNEQKMGLYEGMYEKLQNARDDYEERKQTENKKRDQMLKEWDDQEELLVKQFQTKGTILQRNPRAVSSKLGSLKRHAERKLSEKNKAESKNQKKVS